MERDNNIFILPSLLAFWVSRQLSLNVCSLSPQSGKSGKTVPNLVIIDRSTRLPNFFFLKRSDVYLFLPPILCLYSTGIHYPPTNYLLSPFQLVDAKPQKISCHGLIPLCIMLVVFVCLLFPPIYIWGFLFLKKNRNAMHII